MVDVFVGQALGVRNSNGIRGASFHPAHVTGLLHLVLMMSGPCLFDAGLLLRTHAVHSSLQRMERLLIAITR